MRWFKKLSTVILIILASYFDYVLGRRACCTHFCITDDLEKSNEMITFCIDYVREFYDRKNAACGQPPNKHLFCGSDNAANQSKNNYHFSWMIDYVENDHGLQTLQQNFTVEQHGKGAFIFFQVLKCGLLCELLRVFHEPCFTLRCLGCRGRWRENRCGECGFT